MSLARRTGDQQSLVVGNQTVIIPPDTGVITSLLAVQTHPNTGTTPWNGLHHDGFLTLQQDQT
jgi:hypothetical protein